MSLLDSITKGDAIQNLVKLVGAKVVFDTLSSMATRGECVEAIGKVIYEDESEEAAKKPWTTLTARERRDWTRRASVALLAFRDYVLNRK